MKIKLPNKFYFNNSDGEFSDQEITFGKLLGDGVSGKVYICKINSKKYAVKICEYKENKSPYILDRIDHIDSFRHPNITRHYTGHFSAHYTYVIMDYFSQLLYDKLKNNKIEISWHLKIQIISDIASAIQCLHTHHIIHNDLKSKNILLDSDTAKLCDFDSAKYSDQISRGGTRRYRPPEYYTDLSCSNTMATEIFSFSKLAWVIATRREPYSAFSYEDPNLIIKLTNNEGEPIPNDCPPGIAKLITLGCLTKKEDRPCINDMVEILNDTKSTLTLS